MSLQITAGRAALLSASGTDNNPIFAWDNRAASAVVSTNRPSVAFPVENAVTGTTFDPFMPPQNPIISSPYVAMDFGSAYAPEFCAIAANNLAAIGVNTVLVQSSPDNTTWTNIATLVPTADPCDAVWLGSVTARRYWRVLISNLPALAEPRIGVVYLGGVLQMPRRLYSGISPILGPTEVELQSNVSAGGHLLGTAIVRRGARASFDFAWLPDTFVRGAAWRAFMAHFAAGKPFFAAWRPTEMSADLYYMWRDGAIPLAQYSAPGRLMDLTIEGRVYAG